jgi:hypothetical protein
MRTKKRMGGKRGADGRRGRVEEARDGRRSRGREARGEAVMGEGEKTTRARLERGREDAHRLLSTAREPN